MLTGLSPRPAIGRTFRLSGFSDGASASEAHVRLLIAKVCDETGVPSRMVDVEFAPGQDFTIHAPAGFLEQLAEDPSVESVFDDEDYNDLRGTSVTRVG